MFGWRDSKNFGSFEKFFFILLKGHKGSIESVVEIQKGVIASFSLDEYIRIWDTYMKKYLKKIKVKRALIDIDYYLTGDLMVISFFLDAIKEKPKY